MITLGKSRIIMILYLSMIMTWYSAHAQFEAQPAWSASNTNRIMDIAVADLNNDGAPDLLAAAISGDGKNIKGNILMFLQKNGKFPAKADREFKIKFPRGLATGDFDGDGKIDFAVSENAYNIHLFLGKDNFNTPYSNRSINQYQVKVCAGKLSKAGKTDFLCGPVWRKWYGGKNFVSGYVYAPKGEKYNTNAAINDINGDETADMVFASTKNIRIYIGPFSTQRVKQVNVSKFYNLPAPVSPVSLQVADINNDSLPDIIFCGNYKQNKQGIMAYVQDRFNGFEKQDTPVALIKGLSGNLISGDFNNDDFTDIVVANSAYSRPQIRVFLGSEKGLDNLSGANAAQKITVKTKQIMVIKTADLNKDGKKDLIIGGMGNLFIYLNAQK